LYFITKDFLPISCLHLQDEMEQQQVILNSRRATILRWVWL